MSEGRGHGQCLLSCVVKGQISEVKEQSSACGVILNPEEGLVITHGSLLTDLCLQDPHFRQKISRGDFIDSQILEKCVFSILLDKIWFPKTNNLTLHSIQTLETSDKGRNKKYTDSFTRTQSTFLGAFRNNYFHETLCTLMPDRNWKFTDLAVSESAESVEETDENSTKTDESDVIFQLMSYFIVLRIDPLVLTDRGDGGTDALQDLLLEKSMCCVGDVAGEMKIINFAL